MGFDLLIYFRACVRLHKSGLSLSDWRWTQRGESEEEEAEEAPQKS